MVKYKLLLGLVLVTIGVIIGLNYLESAPPVQTGKSYKLQSTLKEGDKEVIIYKLDASADAQIPSMPKHSLINLYSRLEQEIEQKISKINDNQIIRLERTYRSSKYYINKSSQTPKPEPLEGKKMIIESDGTITPTPATNQIPQEIKQFLSIDEHRFALILPTEEIQVKSEWEVSQETVIRIFNFSNHKKRTTSHGCSEVGINARFSAGSLKCLLKEVKQVGGQESAVIEMTLNLKGEDNGLGIDANLKGTAFFAIKKSRFSKVKLSGEITLDGNQPCTKTAKEDRVTGKGKLKISYEFK